MLTEWTEKRLKSQLVVLTFIWIAMMLSQGTLAIALFNRPNPGGVAPHTATELLHDPLAHVMGFCAILVLALSRYADRFFLNPQTVRRFRAEPQSTEQLRSLRAGKGQTPLYSEADIQTLLSLPESERLTVRLTSPYTIAKIVQYALCDACGIFGFVIALRSHTPLAFLPFAAAAIVGILISPPRRSDLLELAKLH